MIMIATVTIMGILFWMFDEIIAEYVLIALLLIDKYFKVTILEKSGLLNIEGASLRYSYYSPSNHPESCAYMLVRKKCSDVTKPVTF
jgi:hypothetical protein